MKSGVYTCVIWWYTYSVYHSMITTIVSASTPITAHNYHFLFVERPLRSALLATLKYIIIVLLTLVTMLYVRFPKLTHPVTGHLHLLTDIYPTPHSLATTIPQSVSMSAFFFFYSTCYIIQYLHFLCLICFISIVPTRSILVANGRISFDISMADYLSQYSPMAPRPVQEGLDLVHNHLQGSHLGPRSVCLLPKA